MCSGMCFIINVDHYEIQIHMACSSYCELYKQVIEWKAALADVIFEVVLPRRCFVDI